MKQPYMLPIIYCQYHACWCPGDLRSQSIRKYGINQISRHSVSSIIRVNYQFTESQTPRLTNVFIVDGYIEVHHSATYQQDSTQHHIELQKQVLLWPNVRQEEGKLAAQVGPRGADMWREVLSPLSGSLGGGTVCWIGFSSQKCLMKWNYYN